MHALKTVEKIIIASVTQMNNKALCLRYPAYNRLQWLQLCMCVCVFVLQVNMYMFASE